MKQIFIILVLFINSEAFDLPKLIELAHKNEQVQSYYDRDRASSLNYQSTKSSYMPRIDLGGTASYIDKKGSFEAGDTYKAYAEANFIILDGFRRENILDEKRMLKNVTNYELEGFKKALSLQMIQLYFNLEKVEEDIIALKKNREQLNEQLERFKLFYGAGIATEEDVERLNAAVANADYAIIARKFEVDSLMSRLELLSGQPLEGSLIKRVIKERLSSTAQILDRLKAIDFQVKALGYRAEQANASYYPTLLLNDTYTYYNYQDFNPIFPVELVNKQNRLTLQLSINLTDFSAASEQYQAIKMQQNALQEELIFEQKSAIADRKLALKAIKRAKTLLEAAKKSKEAFDRTLLVVTKKYEARIVDYIRYLDALSKATEARAQYNSAFSSLNSARASYIFNLGEDPKEYVE